MSWASEQINLLEYVIHHEDVRRGGVPSAEPRTLPPAQLQAIWKQLPLMARLRFRRSPVPLVLARSDGPTAMIKKGDDPVVLTGTPVELALYVSGRRAAAQVEVSGPPAAVASYEAWVGAS